MTTETNLGVAAAAGASRPRWLAGLLVTLVDTTFGKMLRIRRAHSICDVMVVCYNEGRGLKPLQVLLPHQLYEEGVRKILDSYPDCDEIVCILARGEDYVRVWRKPVTGADATGAASSKTD